MISWIWLVTTPFHIADIQVNNILLGIDDSDGSFEEYVNKEHSDPSPHKVLNEEHVVYISRNLHPNSYGRPVLCDFGEARFILEEGYSEDIQPVQYRAPEVILGIPWNEKVDIWSVGVMVRIQHTMLDPDQSNATNRYGTCSRRSICFRSLVTQP